MRDFLGVMPVAAQSATAYAAYALTLLAWAVLAWRVRRYQILMRHLKQMPPHDRLAAMKAEIGSIEITGGVTAEQWLRSRIHNFYFIAFLVLCFVVLIVVSMAMFTEKGSVTGSISLGT